MLPFGIDCRMNGELHQSCDSKTYFNRHTVLNVDCYLRQGGCNARALFVCLDPESRSVSISRIRTPDPDQIRLGGGLCSLSTLVCL